MATTLDEDADNRQISENINRKAKLRQNHFKYRHSVP